MLWGSDAEFEHAMESLRKGMNETGIGAVETRLVRKNGSWFEAHVLTARLNPPDPTSDVIAAISDVTERKRSAEALRESEAEYRTLFDTMAQGVVYQAATGAIISANPAAERILGLSREEILDRTSQDHRWNAVREDGSPFPGEEHPSMVALRTGKEVRNVVMGMPHPETGDYLWINIHATPQFSPGEDRPYQVYTVFDDITERRRAEQRLLNYQEQLRRLASELSMAEQRERQRLAAYLHDDIVQGLALGKIKLGELQAAAPPGIVQDLAESVRGVISRLIEDARSMTMELNPPVLHQLGLAVAIEDLVETLQEGSPVLFTFADDGKPKPLDKDILLILYRSVREVLINAVKHAQARHIRVSKRRCEDWVEVVVEDDGVGMNVSEIDERKPRSGGFGLFSVRERIQCAGGQFALESEPGRGTRVVLKAPLKRTS
jgi:PAS domain S-box-containing protein